MINWAELTGESDADKSAINTQKSGYIPQKVGTVGTGLKKVGTSKPSNDAGLRDLSPLSPLSPLKKQGAGFDKEKNNLPEEAVASDNYRDAKYNLINPIAVTLLLTCCYRVNATNEEIANQLLKLREMNQADQIRAWATHCLENRIDPHQTIYPFTKSPGKGFDCMSCKHIDMQSNRRLGERRLFRWSCKKGHQIMESYLITEHVLVSPVDCSDYSNDTPST